MYCPLCAIRQNEMRRFLEMNMMKCVSKSRHSDCFLFLECAWQKNKKKPYSLYSLHENAGLPDVCQNFMFDFANHVFRDQPEADMD